MNSAEYGFPQRRKRVYILAVRTGEAWDLGARLGGGVMARAFPVERFDGWDSFELLPTPAENSERFGAGLAASPFKAAGAMQAGRVATADVEARYGGPRAALGDVLVPEEEVPADYFVPEGQRGEWEYLKGAKRIERVSKSGHAYTYSEGSMAYPDPLDRPSRTILTGEGGRTPSRFKHVVECPDGRLRRLVPEELERLQGFPAGWTATGMTDGNRAYCNLNEGIGKVMRFGAYGEDVLTRHRWMRDVLMPVLSAALGRMERGIDLTAMMAQGITMGDEFHQRNIASSALLMRALAPQIARLDHDKQHIAEVMDFLSVTDQFFLNLAMAYCKAAMDAGAMIRAGSIVTAMTRNGNMFGIRVSGLGERWFTAPVNTPQGLFFTGFSQEQANPDMGDSAITETFGIGGAAMIAAPGVTRFVGAGGMEAARAVSEEMAEIYLERNMQLQIPGWDFQGACLGLDIRRVVETGITPLINTGIAHKEAGIGQIGAGTVRAPLACFEQALEALAESMGIG